MADKLEPQKVLDAIKNCCVDDQQIVLEYAYDMIKRMIDNYIPVVRCKDCQYGKVSNMGGCVWCTCYEIHKSLNGFCDYGEWKDGESDATD